jgi:hypothetical protein
MDYIKLVLPVLFIIAIWFLINKLKVRDNIYFNILQLVLISFVLGLFVQNFLKETSVKNLIVVLLFLFVGGYEVFYKKIYKKVKNIE